MKRAAFAFVIIALALPVAGSRLPVRDPVLDALVLDAVGANFDLRIAAARVREERALRGITAARSKPQVAGAASAVEFERSIAAPGFGDRRQELYDAGFDASWEIDLFGGTRHDVAAAVAQVQATDEQRRDVEITLIAEVARNYVELRGAQKRLDVLDARIETIRETLSVVRARQQAGLTNDLDVARSEALLEDTLAARPSLEFAAAATMHRLAVLTGRQPEELVERLTAHAPIPAVSAQLSEGVPLEIIEHRPDIQRAERELAAATARIGVARADLYPRVALFGGFGRRSDNTSNLVHSISNYWSFGPALRWPLLTGGRVHAQIDATSARRDQADAAFHQTVLRAMEEVENAFAGYGRDQRERDRLAAAVAAETRAVDLADSRYRAGLDNFLAVLDAQRTLRDGEDRLASAETRVGVSAISVYKAVGGAAIQ
ncbi:MAG TPA: efflux transporter outer membrane subunit [Thermoanaerobaculia bacterium]|nr:efflux transporter outer membrane subunit [Thermoanaerobaculia bacterium]